MLVVDASAVVETLITPEPAERLVDRVAGDGDLVAPHLIDIETLQALRRMVRHQRLGVDRANDARGDFEALNLTRFPHEPFIDRIWELRENLTAYDASYVALAEVLSVPLITCDAGLAAASGHSAEIELYEPA